MQYPVIDNLINAYIKNGWTGLVVKQFSIWDEEWENGYYNRTNGNKAGNSDTTYYRNKNYIRCVPNCSYYFVPPSVHANNNTWYAVLFYDENKNFISATNNVSDYPIRTAPNNAHYINFYVEVGTSGATYNNDISINFPSSYHEYINYIDSINNEKYNKNNIAHRLKLPLPHYFPHPVIDSLKRASEGTMTNKDREILTHYLTPLGIGGI